METAQSIRAACRGSRPGQVPNVPYGSVAPAVSVGESLLQVPLPLLGACLPFRLCLRLGRVIGRNLLRSSARESGLFGVPCAFFFSDPLSLALGLAARILALLALPAATSLVWCLVAPPATASLLT